jgi:hypothetical protein
MVSPSRFVPCADETLLDRRQPSNGLLALLGFLAKVPSSSSFLVTRVARAVDGGDTGANRGAAGVSSTLGFRGVSIERSASSSMSVIASSSSSNLGAMSCSLGGKSRRGWIEERVVRRGSPKSSTSASSNSDATSPSSSSSPSGLPPEAGFQMLFPRLHRMLALEAACR